MLDPLSHMGALYAAVEGGLIPYAYASSAATHPFTLRPGDLHPPIPSIEHYGAAIRSDAFRRSPAFWREVDEELAAYGMRYEGVVLLGARPADHAIFEERGFVADWARGATFLGHFEPCGVDVAAPAQTAGKTVSVDVGWGQFQPIDAARVDGALGPDGLAHYRLPQAPCGQVRVRARWSPEAPGAPWQTCAGADDGGFVATTLSRSAHEIACGSLVALVDSRGPIPPNRPKQGTP
jgi:hypothetical protein